MAKLIVSPKGKAHFPKLNKADTKFVVEGVYSSDIIVSLAEAEPLMKSLAAKYKAFVGKAPAKSKNSMWEMVLDDDGNETGEVQLKFRVKNRKGWDRKPNLVDSKKHPIDVMVTGGSTIKVAFEIFEYEWGGKKGLTLQPMAVQILELATYESSNADVFGEEEGFVVEEDDAFDDEEEVTEEVTEDGDEEDDF